MKNSVSPTLESSLMRRIQLHLSKFTCRLFRNNVGQANINGRVIKYGLCTGSSDLVGWSQVTITPDMIGQTLAVFTAIEIKTHTKATPEQLAFIDTVKRAGGRAGIAHTIRDAEAIINGR